MLEVYLIITLVLVITSLNISIKPRRSMSLKDMGFWQFIDVMSDNPVIHGLKAEEKNKSAYEMFRNAVRNSDVQYLTIDRLQTISILSVGITAILLVILHIIKVVNFHIMYPTLVELSEKLLNEALLVEPKLDLVYLGLESTVGYFLPIGYLKFKAMARGKKAMSEVLMLQTFLAMGLQTNKNVKYILLTLYKRSDVFKEPLRTALQNYSIDPMKALDELRKSVERPEFETIVNTLEKSLLNRSMAREYLETTREMEKSLRSLGVSRQEQGRQVIGTVMIMLPLAAAVALVGYPWFVYNMKLMTALNAV